MSFRKFLAAATVSHLLLAGIPALAIDLVHRKSTEKTIGGEVTKNTRDSVTITQQVGMKEETIPAADIAYIEWDAEPGPVKLARGSETTGALDEAIRQYQEALKGIGGAKEGLKADVQFGLARASARRAIRTGEDLAGATTGVKNFVNGNRDNYRFYDAQQLLGEISLAAGDFAAAEMAYQSVASAESNELKKAGKIGLGRSFLGRGEVDKARQLFDEVASQPAASTVEAAHRLAAILGQATCLQQKKELAEARKLVSQVINETTAAKDRPFDGRIQAEAYLRQGDLLSADEGNPKPAIIAYLHVDVIPEFSEERDLHAEALYHLARLWPLVGEAERGADAANRLKTQYPDSVWNRRLGGK